MRKLKDKCNVHKSIFWGLISEKFIRNTRVIWKHNSLKKMEIMEENQSYLKA